MRAWENITLGTLVEIDKVNKTEFDTQIDKQVRLLSLISGKPEEAILDLSRVNFIKLQDKYKFMDELPAQKAVKEFDCGGYTWIPETDITKIKTEQYMDVSYLLKDTDKLIENLPAMLACYCTPVKRYPLFIKIKPKLDYKQKVELLKQAKVNDVYPLSLFFCRVLIHLTNGMRGSLEEQMTRITKATKPHKMRSANNGDGT